jgi:hypothetical protein
MFGAHMFLMLCHFLHYEVRCSSQYHLRSVPFIITYYIHRSSYYHHFQHYQEPSSVPRANDDDDKQRPRKYEQR